jgi:hypothetical protein
MLNVMDPKTFIRFARILLYGTAVLLAMVPLLVLLDLAGGGSGFGLCPTGVDSCRNPYTAAPELSAILTVALIVVLAGVRVTTRAERRLDRRNRNHPI